MLHRPFKFPPVISYFSCAIRNVVDERNKPAGKVAITQHDSKIYFSRQLAPTSLHVLYAEAIEDRKRNMLRCCQVDSVLILIASRASNKATVTLNI